MSPHDATIYAVAAIATTCGAVLTKTLDVFGRRREHSGGIETSSAGDLWQAVREERVRQVAEIARMDGRMDQLQKDNTALREANARLVVEIDNLRDRHRALITRNQELVVANQSLERRVEALLERIGERADDVPPGLHRASDTV